MKFRMLFVGVLVFSITLVGPSMPRGDEGLSVDDIWVACWEGQEFIRKLSYPQPISLEIYNSSSDDIEICVYDNRCPRTIFKGRLKPRRHIYRSACTDEEWGYGSVTVMDASGDIRFFEKTRGRKITFR